MAVVKLELGVFSRVSSGKSAGSKVRLTMWVFLIHGGHANLLSLVILVGVCIVCLHS